MPAAEKAISLNPNDASTLANLGYYYGTAGMFERGLPLLEKAMALSPYHQGWMYQPFFWQAYTAEDYEAALDVINEGFEPGHWWTLMYRAAAYAQLGQMANAGSDATEMLKMFPEMPNQIMNIMRAFNMPEPTMEQFAEGLRKAGVDIPAEPPPPTNWCWVRAVGSARN